MPRPVQYKIEDIKEMIRIKETLGIPIKKQCLDSSIPYVSINRAFARYSLKIPRTYAAVKHSLNPTAVDIAKIKRSKAKKEEAVTV